MSAETSPRQSSYIHNGYAHHTPLTSASSSHLPSSTQTYVDSANTSFSSDDFKDFKVEESGLGKKNGGPGSADGKAKPHICQICQRGFTTGGHLQRHQRIHSGVKAFRCPFPGCETRTSRQDNLQQHYRTHLSPRMRRGSGSQARAAVAVAMEAAGLKSNSSRGARKSKGSAGGTPSSATSAGMSHLPSPYQTPIGHGGPPGSYVPYQMYDPSQGSYGYPSHIAPPLPPSHLTQPHSATSSRVPSPVNGQSSSHSSVTSLPNAHGQPPFYSGFSPAYPYSGGPMHHQQAQAYRYGPGGLPTPYGPGPGPHSHHGLYSPGIAPDHHQQQLYSPLQANFPNHSRESSYGVITPGYGAHNPMTNGYPPRTQTSTPLSQNHEDMRFDGGDPRMYARSTHRPPSPRRRTPPDMLSQGVVNPASMSGRPVPPPLQTAYNNYVPHHMSFGYNTVGDGRVGGMPLGHRNSVSDMSDGSGGSGESIGEGSDASGVKPMITS